MEMQEVQIWSKNERRHSGICNIGHHVFEKARGSHASHKNRRDWPWMRYSQTQLVRTLMGAYN